MTGTDRNAEIYAKDGAGGAKDGAPDSSRPAIELDEVSIRFDGRPVLDGFSLALHQGEKVALTGRSGCGKSTVLHMLMGFVEPARGEIRILGQHATSASIWNLRRSIALVAQEPVLGTGTVDAILDRPFSFKANIHLRPNLDRVPALFDRFLLPAHLREKDISQLSGGEKQRVALVSALLLDRLILLLDEVSSALDPESKQAVGEYLRDCADLTILSVSHDENAHKYADRTVDLSRFRAHPPQAERGDP